MRLPEDSGSCRWLSSFRGSNHGSSRRRKTLRKEEIPTGIRNVSPCRHLVGRGDPHHGPCLAALQHRGIAHPERHFVVLRASSGSARISRRSARLRRDCLRSGAIWACSAPAPREARSCSRTARSLPVATVRLCTRRAGTRSATLRTRVPANRRRSLLLQHAPELAFQPARLRAQERSGLDPARHAADPFGLRAAGFLLRWSVREAEATSASSSVLLRRDSARRISSSRCVHQRFVLSAAPTFRSRSYCSRCCPFTGSARNSPRAWLHAPHALDRSTATVLILVARTVPPSELAAMIDSPSPCACLASIALEPRLIGSFSRRDGRWAQPLRIAVPGRTSVRRGRSTVSLVVAGAPAPIALFVASPSTTLIAAGVTASLAARVLGRWHTNLPSPM